MINCVTHADTLMQAAREHATLAFAGLLAEEPSPLELRTAAIHAGAAVELLTKALVWQANPLLVLQVKSSHSARFLATRGALEERDLEHARTVSASEAASLAALTASMTPGTDIDALRAASGLADGILGARNARRTHGRHPARSRKLI